LRSGYQIGIGGHSVKDTLPRFDDLFMSNFTTLVRWRRDVRRFRQDPVDKNLLEDIVHLASFSPSVGYSQPWRFIRVQNPSLRSAIRASFLACNQAALESYEGERAELYAKLKLAGLDQAPEHLAVFCDMETDVGQGLGRKTMPEMLEYSAVIAVHTLWLAARAQGLGVGWVSILDPLEVKRVLDTPSAWRLIAYLCIGYAEEEHLDPELARHKWEHYRKPEILVR
jgi:5,6-dimethylbenzimidazole synthase